MKDFPEFFENEHEKLVKLDEDWIKSAEGKQRWRVFIESCVCRGDEYFVVFPFAEQRLFSCNRYEKKVKDYNFGSLIRTDAKQEYGEKNTIFGGLDPFSRCKL